MRVMHYFDTSRRAGLIQRGGIATSLSETGQQWDGCNAWPPIQAMLIEAAENVHRAQKRTRAGPGGRLLAQAWLETCFKAWQKHGQMVGCVALLCVLCLLHLSITLESVRVMRKNTTRPL